MISNQWGQLSTGSLSSRESRFQQYCHQSALPDQHNLSTKVCLVFSCIPVYFFTFEDFCSHRDRRAQQICPMLDLSPADSSRKQRQNRARGAGGGLSKWHQGWGPRDKRRSQGRRRPHGAELWSLFPTMLGDATADTCSETKATGEVFVLMP